MKLTRRNGEVADIDTTMVRATLANFEGELIDARDARYESARRVWNGLIDRRPGLIAQCRTETDVLAALEVARQYELLVTVRGGGHQVAGTAVCDDGLVIDLGLMKGVEVEPDRRLVRAEGGVVWGELDRATQEHGLATPGGEVSTTGIAGLTLGGGMGMLQRRWGLSCDNLESVTIATSDGVLRVANRSDDSELFWALRGGGRGLGVVTSFQFRLHELGPEVMASLVFYPFDRAEQVLSGWRDFTAQAPDEVTSQIVLWTVPPHPAMPPEVHDRAVAVALGLYAGGLAEGREALRPLSTLAKPLLDASGPTNYVELQSSLDELLPTGGRYYWKSLYVDQLESDLIRQLVECARHRPSSRTLVVLRHLGGAVARVAEGDTAYANRKARYNLSLDSTWTEPEADARNIAWTRETWDQLRPHSTGGVYANFAGFADESAGLQSATHGDNLSRLVRARQRYDPTRLFGGPH